jgi:hypothetical protein
MDLLSSAIVPLLVGGLGAWIGARITLSEERKRAANARKVKWLEDTITALWSAWPSIVKDPPEEWPLAEIIDDRLTDPNCALVPKYSLDLVRDLYSKFERASVHGADWAAYDMTIFLPSAIDELSEDLRRALGFRLTLAETRRQRGADREQMKAWENYSAAVKRGEKPTWTGRGPAPTIITKDGIYRSED